MLQHLLNDISFGEW